MTTKAVVSVLAGVALIASLTAYAGASSGAAMSSGTDVGLIRQPAAKRLPEGLVLPASDVNLTVASLVTADLDSDGDLDVIAADASSGSLRIVVWENDGAGRLTRKRPARQRSLGGEPAAPSVDQGQATVVVSIQSNAPAIETIGVNAWLTLPSRPRDLPASSDAPSAALATLRSRSPPNLS
jgi:hypothetical protein